MPCPAAAKRSNAPIAVSTRPAAPGSVSPIRQPGTATRSISATLAKGARVQAAAAPAAPAPMIATSTFLSLIAVAAAVHWGND